MYEAVVFLSIYLWLNVISRFWTIIMWISKFIWSFGLLVILKSTALFAYLFPFNFNTPHSHSFSFHLFIVLLWCSVRFFGGYNSANKNKSNFHHQLNFHPSHKLLLLISLFPNLARFLFGFRFCPLAIYFFISCSSISLVSNWRAWFCRSFVFFFLNLYLFTAWC